MPVFAQIDIIHSENNSKRKDGVLNANLKIKVEESKCFVFPLTRIDTK